MRSRKNSIIFVLVAIAIATGAWAFLHRMPSEPVYDGRRVSAWLEDLPPFRPASSQPPGSAQNTDEAEKALKKIGPAAVPFIIQKLNNYDSPWRNKYRVIWPKLPAFAQRHLTKPTEIGFASDQAARAFQCLGTNAYPYLLPKLGDRNPAVREAVIKCLNSGIPQFIPTNQALAIGQRMLLDRDPMVRLQATSILQKFGRAASNAVPNLVLALMSDERGRHIMYNERVWIRAWAATTLGKIGPAASSALPALTNMMAVMNSDSNFRICAATAVWEISSNELLCLPVLTNELQTRGPSYDPNYLRRRAVIVLKEIGPRAKDAFPLLTNQLKNADPDYFNALSNALFSIDPDAATKVFREIPPIAKP